MVGVGTLASNKSLKSCLCSSASTAHPGTWDLPRSSVTRSILLAAAWWLPGGHCAWAPNCRANTSRKHAARSIGHSLCLMFDIPQLFGRGQTSLWIEWSQSSLLTAATRHSGYPLDISDCRHLVQWTATSCSWARRRARIRKWSIWLNWIEIFEWAEEFVRMFHFFSRGRILAWAHNMGFCRYLSQWHYIFVFWDNIRQPFCLAILCRRRWAPQALRRSGSQPWFASASSGVPNM